MRCLDSIEFFLRRHNGKKIGREFLGNSLKLAGASLAFVAFDDLYALEATTNTISPIKETNNE